MLALHPTAQKAAPSEGGNQTLAAVRPQYLKQGSRPNWPKKQRFMFALAAQFITTLC